MNIFLRKCDNYDTEIKKRISYEIDFDTFRGFASDDIKRQY
jgi:hypothetical protein